MIYYDFYWFVHDFMILDKSSKSYSEGKSSLGLKLIIQTFDIRMEFMIWCCYWH